MWVIMSRRTLPHESWLFPLVDLWFLIRRHFHPNESPLQLTSAVVSLSGAIARHVCQYNWTVSKSNYWSNERAVPWWSVIVMKLGNDLNSVLLSASNPPFAFVNCFVHVFAHGLCLAAFSDVRRNNAITLRKEDTRDYELTMKMIEIKFVFISHGQCRFIHRGQSSVTVAGFVSPILSR